MVDMTSNQQSVVDHDTFTVRRTLWIAAPVERVWSVVTEPEQISRWFGRAEFDGSGVGADGTLTFETRRIPIRIEQIDRPRMVAYRWTNDDEAARLPERVDPDHSTVFTFTLDSVDNGTQLTVVETGFETLSDPAADLESHRLGWDSELDKLVALVEGGA